jgi:ribosomal protein L16 Arg81 hydroxylase
MQKLALILCCTLLVLSSRAQDGEWVPENDQIRAQRAAYITQRLQLNSAEAAHFWQVFNEYEAAKEALKKSFRTEISRPTTEAEADQLIQRRFELEEALLRLSRKFYTDVKTKVPATKLALLPQAENEFKRDLLRQIRERRQQSGRSNRG